MNIPLRNVKIVACFFVKLNSKVLWANDAFTNMLTPVQTCSLPHVGAFMGSNQLLRDPVPTCADGEPLDRVRQHARTTTTLPLLCEPLRTDCSGAGTAYVLNQNVLTEIVAPGLTSDCLGGVSTKDWTCCSVSTVFLLFTAFFSPVFAASLPSFFEFNF